MSGREAAVHAVRETEREARVMIRVRIEVHSGAARFGVAVQAESIRRALSVVESRCPGRKCQVKFPIEPEGFFLEGAGARAGTFERPKEMAA